MKRSKAISLVLVSSGIVLGGGSTYLVHLATAAGDNEFSEASQTDVEPATFGAPPTAGDGGNDVRGTIHQSASVIEDPSLKNNSFQRKLVVYSYVAGLPEQQISKELQRTTGNSSKLSPSVLEELQTALVARLAILNPVAAMEFAVAQKDLGTDTLTHTPWGSQQYLPQRIETTFMPLVRSVFKEWALSDLNVAVKNAKSLKSDDKKNALAGILNALTGESLKTYRRIAKELGDEDQGIDSYVRSFSAKRIDDPRAIWAEVVKLIKPGDYNQTVALGNIARQWYKQEGIAVLDEINSSSLTDNVKGSTVRQVLSLVATEKPERAFQYALTLPSEGTFSSPLFSVVSTWAASDPQAAYQAVTGIEQSGQREGLQRIVVTNWASKEPYYFLENLDIFPPQMRDLGSSSALEVIARTSPQEAAEIALEQIEERLGGYSYVPTQIIRHWIQQDVEAAVSWVFNGPVSEEKRHTWVSALATNLVASDPRRAFELALKQPKPEGTMNAYGFALEGQIIGQIVMQDLDLAVELLPKVREGFSRSQAYSSVGNKYIDLGDTSKALDLGLKLPADEQAAYFQSIAYSWAKIDPGGLVESFKNFPTAELRSSLARTMSSQWMKDSFTDTQLDVLKQYLSDSDRKGLESQ